MQGYEAKSVALGAAANLLLDGVATTKSLVAAAIAYLAGMTDKNTFVKKCVKNKPYCQLILYSQCKTEFDSDALCALHKSLYEPREQCGEIRNEELTLTGGSCTDPKMLRGSLKNVLGKLCKLQGAPTVSKADFAAALSCYLRELIILSPFAYGNGVARRAFIQNFCRTRGFTLSYAAVSKKDFESAEEQAFAADDPQPLFTVLQKCLNYLQEPSAREKVPPKPSARALSPVAKPTRAINETAAKTTRTSLETAASAETNVPRLTRRNAKPESADTLRKIKEIQKSLALLAQKVDALVKSLEND